MALRTARPAARRRPIRPVSTPLRGANPGSPARGAGPAQQQPPQQPQAPTVDYSSDPILLQIRALSQQNLAGAQAAATAARTQALEGYGFDGSLNYGDANTAAVAKANPNSVLAVLARANDQRQRGITNADNSRNLFYSSAYSNDLSRNAQAYQGEQQSAAERLRDILGGITSSLASSQQSEAERVAQAEQDAYERALAYQLANPSAAPAARTITATPASRTLSALRNQLLRRRPA